MIMTQYKHLNLTYLESLIGDDNDTKMVILSTLLEEIPEEIGKLDDLLKYKDWNNFHEVSHKLKSTLAYVGNTPIFDANQEMMMAARNMENLDTIPTNLQIVKQQWALLLPEVEAALAEVS